MLWHSNLLRSAPPKMSSEACHCLMQLSRCIGLLRDPAHALANFVGFIWFQISHAFHLIFPSLLYLYLDAQVQCEIAA